MIKRKIVSLLLVATLIISLVGCGKDEEINGDVVDETNEVEVAIDKSEEVLEENIVEKNGVVVTKELSSVNIPMVVTSTYDKDGNVIDESKVFDYQLILGDVYNLEDEESYAKTFKNEVSKATDEWMLLKLDYNEEDNTIALWGNDLKPEFLSYFMVMYELDFKDIFMESYNNIFDDNKVLEFRTEVAVKEEIEDTEEVNEEVMYDDDGNVVYVSDYVPKETNEDSAVTGGVNISSIPMYDQSQTHTSEDLVLLTYGLYASNSGTITVYTTFDSGIAGERIDLMEYTYSPYNTTETIYGRLTVKNTSRKFNDKYKYKEYDYGESLNDNISKHGILKVTQFGFVLDGTVYHKVPQGISYTKDPYSHKDYKNNGNGTTWLDYSRVIDGIVVEYGDYGNGEVVNNVYYLLHGGWEYNKTGYKYDYYNPTYNYKDSMWLSFNPDGIY